MFAVLLNFERIY